MRDGLGCGKTPQGQRRLQCLKKERKRRYAVSSVDMGCVDRHITQEACNVMTEPGRACLLEGGCAQSFRDRALSNRIPWHNNQ